MKIWVHFLVSSALVGIFFPAYGWRALLIIAGGVLIDIDHYFWYIYKFKKFSLIDCYNYFIDGMDKSRIMKNAGILLVFHTIEVLVLVILLSFYSKLALMFTIGLLSHYLLDGIFLCTVAKRFIANPSILNWIVRNKIQKV